MNQALHWGKNVLLLFLHAVGSANPFFNSVYHALYHIVLSLISQAPSCLTACVSILYAPITRYVSDCIVFIKAKNNTTRLFSTFRHLTFYFKATAKSCENYIVQLRVFGAERNSRHILYVMPKYLKEKHIKVLFCP